MFPLLSAPTAAEFTNPADVFVDVEVETPALVVAKLSPKAFQNERERSFFPTIFENSSLE